MSNLLNTPDQVLFQNHEYFYQNMSDHISWILMLRKYTREKGGPELHSIPKEKRLTEISLC